MHAPCTMLARTSAAVLTTAAAVGLMAGDAAAWHKHGQAVQYVAAPAASVGVVAVASPVVATAMPVTVLAVPVSAPKHHHHQQLSQAFLAAAPVQYQYVSAPAPTPMPMPMQTVGVGTSYQAAHVAVAPAPANLFLVGATTAANSDRSPFDDDESVAAGVQYPMLTARFGGDALRVTALREHLRSRLYKQARSSGGFFANFNWKGFLWTAAREFVRIEFGFDPANDPAIKDIGQLIRNLLKEEGVPEGGSLPVTPPAAPPVAPPVAPPAPSGSTPFSFQGTGVFNFPGGFPNPDQAPKNDSSGPPAPVGGDPDTPAAKPPTR